MAQSLPANKRKYLRTSQYVYTSSFLARLFSKASPRRATSSVNPPRNAKRSAVFFKPVSRDHPSQEFSLYRNTELSRVLRSLKLEYRKFKLVSAKQRRFVRRDLLSSLPRLNENIRPFPEKATYPSGTRSLSSTTVFSGAQAGHGLWLRFKNPVGGPTTWARSQVNSRVSRLSLYYWAVVYAGHAASRRNFHFLNPAKVRASLPYVVSSDLAPAVTAVSIPGLRSPASSSRDSRLWWKWFSQNQTTGNSRKRQPKGKRKAPSALKPNSLRVGAYHRFLGLRHLRVDGDALQGVLLATNVATQSHVWAPIYSSLAARVFNRFYKLIARRSKLLQLKGESSSLTPGQDVHRLSSLIDLNRYRESLLSGYFSSSRGRRLAGYSLSWLRVGPGSSSLSSAGVLSPSQLSLATDGLGYLSSAEGLSLLEACGDLFFFKKLTSSPLAVKFFIASNLPSVGTLSSFRLSDSNHSKLAINLMHQQRATMFSARSSATRFSNLEFSFNSNFAMRRVIKTHLDNTFLDYRTVYFYTQILNDFAENFTGRNAMLSVNTDIEKGLTSWDHGRMFLWKGRVAGFRRILGPKIFPIEGLQLMVAGLRLKDPTFLANWLRGMLKRLSFWKYRLLFRYFKWILRYLFEPSFKEMGVRGIKFQLKGKISVAGNARTRTLFYKVGEVSHSKMEHKVAYDLSFVETFTGIMGFKLWFFY